MSAADNEIENKNLTNNVKQGCLTDYKNKIHGGIQWDSRSTLT